MYLTIKDVANMLQIKRCTLYLWVAQGKLPALRLGGLIRFRREDIDKWLAGCQIELPNPLHPANRRQQSDDVDTLIARAKAEVYNSSHGKSDQSRANRKGDSHGSV